MQNNTLQLTEQTIKLELSNSLKDSDQIDILYNLMTESKKCRQNIIAINYFPIKVGISRANFNTYLRSLEPFFATAQPIAEQFVDLQSKLRRFAEEYWPEEGQEIMSYPKLQEHFDLFLLNQFKQNIQRQRNSQSTNYLKKFKLIFQNIMDIYSISTNENMISSILQYGIKHLQHLKFQRGFESDPFRQSLHKILSMTQSFIELTKYGGQDIKEIQKNLEFQLFKCLIQLQFPISSIIKIKEELINNPLSNCVANLKIMSEKKTKFYNSKFYQSRLLQKYAQLISYPKSIYAQAIMDASDLLEEISYTCRVTSQLMSLLYKFDLFGLLQHPNIQNNKCQIYRNIRSKYKSYYKAYENIKYLKKNQNDLKFQDQIAKKFELRNKFVECGLIFQKWQQTERSILEKSQGIIHDLSLNLNGKKILREFYHNNLEPYFYKLEKLKNFKQTVEESLFNSFMSNNRIQQKMVSILLQFVAQMMQVDSLQGSNTSQQLTKNELREMVQILNRNIEFKSFKANKGKDLEQQRYYSCKKIRQLIYKINYNNEIQVSYLTIQKFIEAFINNNLQIPNNFQSYVCDMKELKNQYYGQEQEQQKEEKVEIKQKGRVMVKQQDNVKSLDNLAGRMKQLLINFNKFIEEECNKKQESFVMKLRNESFLNKQDTFAELLLKLNPFEIQGVKLTQLGVTSSIKTKNIINELKSINQVTIKKFLQEFIQIYKNINKSSPKNPEKTKDSSSQNDDNQKKSNSTQRSNQRSRQQEMENLNRRKVLIISSFIRQYQSLDSPEEQTKFTSIILNKMTSHEEISENILKANPFQNKQSNILDKFVENKSMSKIQKNNLLKQFQAGKACQIGKKYAKEYRELIQ